MKNKIIYLVLLLLLSTATTPILAQEQCGTELTQVQIDYMNATREARENFKATNLKSNTVNTIPMVAHIVRRTDGTYGLTRAELNISLVQLNAAFEPVDFKFELCEINYIDNSQYTNKIKNSTDSTSLEFEMAHANRVEGKMNVFFIRDIGNLCGWASFPSYKDAYDKDWIVMSNDCTTNGVTLAHEVGHWLNLYHTHQGASENTLLGITEDELVDGSNCGAGVGDELCDTPADPVLGDENVGRDCIYIGNAIDANDDPYTPDPRNIMSYSRKSCKNLFSPQQIARMQTSYEIDRKDDLSACTSSLDCEITTVFVRNTSTCFDNGTPNDTTDDFFTGDVSVYYFGKPDSGRLRLVSQNNSYLTPVNGFDDNGHIFYNVKMPADGNTVSMTSSFTADTNCSLTEEVHRGTSCDPCYMNPGCDPCNMEIVGLYWAKQCNDNDTPEWTDDSFEARIRITSPSWPTSGTLDITGDVQLSIPVEQLNNDEEYHDLPFTIFPANGQPISLTATFSNEDGCSISNTVTGLYPCSNDCQHNAIITNEISGVYFKEVHNYIKASNKILSGADATYDARLKITLEPGFHAHRSSKFHAYLDGCPDNVENKEEPLVSELDTTLGYLRNYPNPFTGQTTIEFVLTQDTPVTLFVSDVTGKQVAVLLNNDEKPQGTHSVTFDGNKYPAGMYYYTIQAGDLYGTQKMILAK